MAVDHVKSDHWPWFWDGWRRYPWGYDRQLLPVAPPRNGSLRNYILDMTEHGAVAGALACSFVAFTLNRLVLSQKENHMLIFSLLAIVIVINFERVRKRVPQELGDKSIRNAYHRTGSVLPEIG